MTLAGLILVYQGFAVSWWRSQIDSQNRLTMTENKYHWFLRTTMVSVVVTLVGTVAPIQVLTGDNYFLWTVPAVLALSIVLVIVVAIEGYKLFKTPYGTIAS